MEAKRYFEEMERAMSRRGAGRKLLLLVKIQDTGGADACLTLWQNEADGSARVLYSTAGRRELNFQLLRKGWQQCHNAQGELTGRFPASADALLEQTDFSAYLREDALDAARAARILRELAHLGGTCCDTPASSATRAGAMITVNSFVGRDAYWSYPAAEAADHLPIAAVLVWLGDFLAGSERRTLQSCPAAVALAAQWDAQAHSPFARPADEIAQSRVQARPNPRPVGRTAPTVQNERWKSFLTVLAAV